MRSEVSSALLSRGFDLLNATVLGVFALLTVYPFLEILQISLSHPGQVEPEYRYALAEWAKTASFDIYGFILAWSRTLRGFGYSIYYTATGICVALILNTLAAYPLSKRRLRFKGPVVVYIALTMFFSGGLIPTYLLVLNLGLVNTVWAIVLPTGFSAWHMIMMLGPKYWYSSAGQLLWIDVQEALNLEITFNEVPYPEKKQITLAMGNIPDLAQVTASESFEYGSVGGFLNLADYLEWMPNLQRWLDRYEQYRFAYTVLDGSLYMAPKFSTQNDKDIQWGYNEDMLVGRPIRCSWATASASRWRSRCRAARWIRTAWP